LDAVTEFKDPFEIRITLPQGHLLRRVVVAQLAVGGPEDQVANRMSPWSEPTDSCVTCWSIWA
jgi:hypothetical protein